LLLIKWRLLNAVYQIRSLLAELHSLEEPQGAQSSTDNSLAMHLSAVQGL